MGRPCSFAIRGLAPPSMTSGIFNSFLVLPKIKKWTKGYIRFIQRSNSKWSAKPNHPTLVLPESARGGSPPSLPEAIRLDDSWGPTGDHSLIIRLQPLDWITKQIFNGGIQSNIIIRSGLETTRWYREWSPPPLSTHLPSLLWIWRWVLSRGVWCPFLSCTLFLILIFLYLNY